MMVYKALPNVQPGQWRELVLSGLPTLATAACACPLTGCVSISEGREALVPQDLVGSEWDFAELYELVFST